MKAISKIIIISVLALMTLILINAFLHTPSTDKNPTPINFTTVSYTHLRAHET